MKTTNTLRFSLSSMLALSAAFTLPNTLRAADHGDGTSASIDRSADIGDVYFFTDPTDATKVVIIGTIQGFIVPSEAGNFGIFDHNVRCRFDIENTGDAVFDKAIDVTFSPRATTAAAAQTQIATIAYAGFGTLPPATAPVTNPTLANSANPQVVTALPGGIDFFAGITDDPFFFDIVGFNRFVAKHVANDMTSVAELSRGRDSFAGYNTMTIALRVPVALLRNVGSTTNKFGVSFSTARRQFEVPQADGTTLSSGPWRQIDRAGVPAVNVALVPFVQKNRYNASNPTVDKSGFFAPGIVGTLTALRASSAAIGTLAGVAVTNGDILRLDVSQASAFPNGRKLNDDVIDTILTIIAGGTLGDSVNANDVNGGVFGTTFPYILQPQQPRPNGTIEDNTRN
jgi:hypothetical protein